MRAPLPLQGLFQLDPYAAFASQVLWLLEKIDEETAYRLHIPSGDPAQNSLAVILASRVYVHSITPLNPKEAIGPHGDEHLLDVARQLQLPEAAIANLGATDSVNHLQRSMIQRIAVTAAHHMFFSPEQRAGTRSDIQQALGQGALVGIQPRDFDWPALVLPGNDGVECWISWPHADEPTSCSVDWVEFHALPMYSVYSLQPFR